MPELEAACRKAANRVGEHEADRTISAPWYAADVFSSAQTAVRQEAQAVLLFYKSAGSSLERYFDMVVQRKIDESAAFFRSMGYTGIDEKLLGLLISVQFDSDRRVVLGSPDAATADGYMNSLMTYYLGGWGAL